MRPARSLITVSRLAVAATLLTALILPSARAQTASLAEACKQANVPPPAAEECEWYAPVVDPVTQTVEEQVPVEYVPAFTPDMPTAAVAWRYGTDTNGLLVPATAGSAGNNPDEDSDEASYTCTLYASDPGRGYYGGEAIVGEGWQGCSGWWYSPIKIVVQVQQYRGWGYWATKEQVDTGYQSTNWLSRYAGWICAAGSGLQTYRIVTLGFSEGGRYQNAVQSGNYLRTHCPG